MAQSKITKKEELDLAYIDGFNSGYDKGYKQGEKDNALTWEDIEDIICIALDVQGETKDEFLMTLSIPERIDNEHREYKEILKRFNDRKNNK